MTRRSEHTPGPWKYGGPVKLASFQMHPSVGDPLWEVGPVRGFATPSPMAMDGIAAVRHKADARLIAAAPDLYAIVERVAAHFENTDAPLGIDARAALAKARGGA